MVEVLGDIVINFNIHLMTSVLPILSGNESLSITQNPPF